MPQDDVVYADLTVEENISFSGRLRLPRAWTPADVPAANRFNMRSESFRAGIAGSGLRWGSEGPRARHLRTPFPVSK